MRESTGPELSLKPVRRELVAQIERIQANLAEHRRRLEESRAQFQLASTRYSDLYDLAPIPFLTVGRGSRIQELNEKAARLLGFPAAWLIGKAFIVFVANQDVSRFLKFLMQSSQSLKAEQTTEIVLDVRRQLVPVQVSVKASMNGDGILHRMSLVDLTDIKRSQFDLQQSQESWHSIIRNAPEIIMVLEGNGTIAFANQPVWGHSVPSLLGKSILDYISAAERPKLRRCMAQVFEKDQRSNCEIVGLDGHGQEAWFSLSFGPVQNPPDAKSAPKKTTLMIREISEHKRTEETLRHSGEQLREFAARLDAVREEERARVAREIHDELGQALTILKLDLAWLQSKTPREHSDARKRMKVMIRQVDQTIDCVRRIASELRPSLLDDLGLVAAIEWQVKEFQKRTRIRSDFRTNTDKSDLTGSQSAAGAAVFRVIQEALTNVMRHARASKVQVDLSSEPSGLKISVVDNGKGMTQERLGNLQSLGIVGMKERIARVGGDFIMESRLGKGTRIDIILPAENNHD